jgi:hypothetical protein
MATGTTRSHLGEERIDLFIYGRSLSYSPDDADIHLILAPRQAGSGSSPCPALPEVADNAIALASRRKVKPS